MSVFLEAARIVADDEEHYCCEAIAEAAKFYGVPRSDYIAGFEKLFKRRVVTCNSTWFDYGWWGCPAYDDNQDARVIALCLAHEIES